MQTRTSAFAMPHAKLKIFGFGPLLALAFLLPALLSPAPAQTLSPSAQNERQGATTGLGMSHRFPSMAAAVSHCPGDIIVWASGPGLTYHLSGAALYGKGIGFYACKAEADDAGFQAASN